MESAGNLSDKCRADRRVQAKCVVVPARLLPSQLRTWVRREAGGVGQCLGSIKAIKLGEVTKRRNRKGIAVAHGPGDLTGVKRNRYLISLPYFERVDGMSA